ncbi:MAG TPA: glycerophosphodiester phosphodiesterase [Mycobacteriales bacterium]|nr:glycerophosphodiester phosphodiesterase [Mycobacteriales bacterium]
MRYGFAHRGGSHGPDNAIATFTEAIALGARGLETDAWLSQDGIVVLDHDGLAGRSGRQPIAEVRRGDLPAHIATLTDLYQSVGSRFDLAVDVKSPTVAAAVLAVAERHGGADKLWLVAPQPADLAGLDGARGVITLRGNVMRSSRRAAALASAHEGGIKAINARWMWWSHAMVAEVQDLGMLAFGYDAQRRSSLDRALAVGLDGVFSDRVERMVAAIAAATATDQTM